MAHCQVVGEPTASITASAPRPPSVSSRITRTGLSSCETSNAARAPSCSAARIWLQRLPKAMTRSEEHTSELQSLAYLVCRLLLEKKKTNKTEPNCAKNRPVALVEDYCLHHLVVI